MSRDPNRIKIIERQAQSSYAWVAACGGTEKPFTLRGKQFLYMWNYVSKLHVYYCITDDVFVKQLRGY